MAIDPDGRMLTVDEVAERLRVHPITVRRHIKAGRLRAVRVGRRVRVRTEDLEAFLQPRAAEARAAYRAPSQAELRRRRKGRVRLHYQWPPTPEETTRRRKIVEAMRKERATLPLLGQSTASLVREGRRDQDEPYRRPPWLGG